MSFIKCDSIHHKNTVHNSTNCSVTSSMCLKIIFFLISSYFTYICTYLHEHHNQTRFVFLMFLLTLRDAFWGIFKN